MVVRGGCVAPAVSEAATLAGSQSLLSSAQLSPRDGGAVWGSRPSSTSTARWSTPTTTTPSRGSGPSATRASRCRSGESTATSAWAATSSSPPWPAIRSFSPARQSPTRWTTTWTCCTPASSPTAGRPPPTWRRPSQPPIWSRSRSERLERSRSSSRSRRSASTSTRHRSASQEAPMPRVQVFDVNETPLDLAAMDPHFERVFGDASLRPVWFAQMIQSALVATVTGAYSQFGAHAMAALEMLADQTGVELGDGDREAIAGQMRRLPAHPEVREALERIRGAGFQLAALTNSTLAVAAEQLEQAGLIDLFDQVLSADTVRRLKPAP